MGNYQTFTKCPGIDSQCTKPMGGNNRNFTFDHTQDTILCMKQGQWPHFPKCYDFNGQQAKLEEEKLEISHLAIYKT